MFSLSSPFLTSSTWVMNRVALLPGSRIVPGGWRWCSQVGVCGKQRWWSFLSLAPLWSWKGEGTRTGSVCTFVPVLPGLGTCGCLTLIGRQNNEVIPAPLQKPHTAVNSTLADRHGEASELVLPITLIWWVRLWQGADLLFNIWGGSFWCVGNMFAEILGVKQDVFICFDGFSWRHYSAFHTYPALSILHRHEDERSDFPVTYWFLWSVGLLQPEKGRAGKDPQASKLTAELKGVFPDPWLPLS